MAVGACVRFGGGGDFALVMIVYGIIQFIDGNILVPLLFSEAVNLHPVAIITAILLFGGLWGAVGCVFRHSIGDVDQGGDQCLAEAGRIPCRCS